MNPLTETLLQLTRRQLLTRGVKAAGTAAALASITGTAGRRTIGADTDARKEGAPKRVGGLPGLPHHPPRAKRFIYLFMGGAPSQLDLFDYKPKLEELFDKDLPDSVRRGQRITTMTSGQKRFPLAPSMFSFAQHGECGAWISELLPHTSKVVDDLAIIRSVYTNAINHDPAMTFIQTGRELPGWPSLGSWLSYGLGISQRESAQLRRHDADLDRPQKSAQALFSRLVGHRISCRPRLQGVALRAQVGDPVLYISRIHPANRQESPPQEDARRARPS